MARSNKSDGSRFKSDGEPVHKHNFNQSPPRMQLAVHELAQSFAPIRVLKFCVTNAKFAHAVEQEADNRCASRLDITFGFVIVEYQRQRLGIEVFESPKRPPIVKVKESISCSNLDLGEILSPRFEAVEDHNCPNLIRYSSTIRRSLGLLSSARSWVSPSA